MVLELAVKGMASTWSSRPLRARKLKVYAGTEHSHVAQQPQVLDINWGFKTMAENQYKKALVVAKAQQLVFSSNQALVRS